MKELKQYPILARIGPAEATVGMISLPLPRAMAADLRIDHPTSAMRPVAWWRRHELPRRSIAYVLDDNGVPDSLGLTDTPVPEQSPSSAWQFRTELTMEREAYKSHSFQDIAGLRGVPAEHCATAQAALHLTFGGRTLIVQAGATGPKGGPYYWESVQIDPLWRTPVAQAIRIGGVMYNEDTYLWADVYMTLFRNGVADVAAHFVNTKLHIEGHDFQGLPLLRLAGDAVAGKSATIPGDGLRFELGGVRLNVADSAILFSEEWPGRIAEADGGVLWYPVSRTFNPQKHDAPQQEWAKGFARTFRFQLSLSDAAPVIARYRAPAWWYAVSGEPWSQGYLPVHGRCNRCGAAAADDVRKTMTRGRFDGGCGRDGPTDGAPGGGFSGASGNDGDAGHGMMLNYYHTGRPELLEDALASCYYWADLAVDHTDFTVHQWVGGWGWKTCAYTKFRDVLSGYLETGDPYLLDTVEMVAEAYWAWYRANWPRCSIGRDNFEIGAWALLWRFLGSEHARERTLELVRMTATVLDSRGSIGGQMGAGPHPGYLSSLYMTGVSMLSVLDAAEAAVEMEELAAVILSALHKLHEQFIRDDREMFPSNYGSTRATWGQSNEWMWAMAALRIYPETARIQGREDEMTRAGLRRAAAVPTPPPEWWGRSGRKVMYYVNPLYADAMLLGARPTPNGVELNPIGEPCCWPAEQTVETPFGELDIRLSVKDASATFTFSSEREFAITVVHRETRIETTSNGHCTLHGNPDEPGWTMASCGWDVRIPQLKPFVARGFPGDIDRGIAEVGVAGIDRLQALGMIRLCDETARILYGREFSPTHARYRKGSRPVLAQIAAELRREVPRESAEAAMAWTAANVPHPHVIGPTPPDRGLIEEDIISSGVGWCNEQVRVFIALCEVMDVPARLCFLFHQNTRAGHTAAEAFIDGRWAFFDVTFNLCVALPDDRLAEGRELSGAYRRLAHDAYREPLSKHYARVLPFVADMPGWCAADRPDANRGGDLLAHIGICNYAVVGVDAC